MSPLSSEYLLALTLYSWGLVHSGVGIDDPHGWEHQAFHHEITVEIFCDFATQYEWSNPDYLKDNHRNLWYSTVQGWQSECKNAPRLWVMDNMPSSTYFSQQVDFAERHIAWLEGQYHTDLWTSRGYWASRLEAAKPLLQGYEHLQRASHMNPYYQTAYIRGCLREAQEIFGKEAIETGRLPPPVPLQHFQRIP